MAAENTDFDVEGFLSERGPVDLPASFAAGDSFGDWRLTAFLGRGGGGEVYRAVHSALGTAAALKTCVEGRGGGAESFNNACARLRREAAFLAANAHPAFPRFLGFGERNGIPWYAMELLEPRELPGKDADAARFLLSVAEGVAHLHSLGYIHRDIKPSNILWRADRPVIADFGLAKDVSLEPGHAGESLSVVGGTAVCVGTPGFAAPEQIAGGEATPASDVYALGVLANECFGGRPRGCWARIVRRSTGSIPGYRYRDAAAFMRAVRFRHLARYFLAGAAAAALAALCVWAALSNARSAREEQSAKERLLRERLEKEHEEIQEMLRLDVY